MRNDDYWGPKPAFKYVRVRIIPEQATADRRADLGRRGHHQGGAARPDGRHQQVGPGAHRDLADPAHRHAPARPGRRAAARTRSPTSGCARRRTWPWTSTRSSSTCSTAWATARRPAINPMAFGFDPSLKPYKQDIAAGQEAPGRRRLPERRGHRLPTRARRSSSPAIQQTTEAIVADLAKAGIRAKQQLHRRQQVLVTADQGRQGRPDVRWSWGYYSVFDADAILYDVFKCGETYSYYCNKALDDLISQGRSTLDARSGPRSTSRPRSCSSTTRPTSTSGGCAACGASQPGRLRGARATRSTGCSS